MLIFVIKKFGPFSLYLFFFKGKIYANLKYETLADDLLKHILKLLNIFHHVFTNTKPVYFPRGQKNDIFIGSKEFQIYNHFGYFGNDYFYLKIYDVVKVSYNNYKVSEIIYFLSCNRKRKYKTFENHICIYVIFYLSLSVICDCWCAFSLRLKYLLNFYVMPKSNQTKYFYIIYIS